MTSVFALAADIGGSHISAGVVDLVTGRLLSQTCNEAHVDSHGACDDILDAWAGCLNAALQQADQIAMAGVGFAMPGPFDYRTGIAHFGASHKYESLCDVAIADALSPRLDRTLEMRFINDATAFGIGEVQRLSKARQVGSRVLAVTLGTGFGSAFLDNGVPVTDGASVPLHGCLWHLPFADGIADDYVSVRWLRAQFAAIRNETVDGVREIAAFARQDPQCAALFSQYGTNLGQAVAEWLVRFGAPSLIIGGSIAGAYDLFAPSLHEALKTAGADVDIVVSRNTDDAAILGAARLFEADFWAQVKEGLPTV